MDGDEDEDGDGDEIKKPGFPLRESGLQQELRKTWGLG